MAAWRLRWLPATVQDLARLDTFLREKSPNAANRSARTIRDAARGLREHPERGRPRDDLDHVRELVVPFGRGAYVLHYRLEPPHVVILRVWHAREER